MEKWTWVKVGWGSSVTIKSKNWEMVDWWVGGWAFRGS